MTGYKILTVGVAIGVILGAFASLTSPAPAQTPVLSGATFPCPGSTSQCFKPPIAGVPLGYQQLTSLSAAATLTIPAGSQEALIICTGQTVNWRDDGTAPTTTVGMPLPVNTSFPYMGNLSALQLIQTSSSATCNVSYYR